MGDLPELSMMHGSELSTVEPESASGLFNCSPPRESTSSVNLFRSLSLGSSASAADIEREGLRGSFVCSCDANNREVNKGNCFRVKLQLYAYKPRSDGTMAKSLLVGVLEDVLGQYIEGVLLENLQIGMWSGVVELSNLKLKSSALEKLKLRIRVERGSLKKLSVKIPWASLDSKPVTISLDGIYLQAGPLDLSGVCVFVCVCVSIHSPPTGKRGLENFAKNCQKIACG
jgi:hypothetical protein